MQKPFLKWVGGKTQIINTLIKTFPKKMNNYHELFLGGGSVLFSILYLQKNKKIEITGDINVYDLNTTLINLYKNIKEDYNEIFNQYNLIIKDYYNIPTLKSLVKHNKENPIKQYHSLLSKEQYYYWMRKKYNEIDESFEKSALFLFLNKHGFRGMYREGPTGFNIPFGNYKRPQILELKKLKIISNLIQKVNFYNMTFQDSIKNIKEGDFTYLDPPYFPMDEKSFVGYTKLGFNKDLHDILFNNIIDLHEKKIKFLMSNSDVNIIKDKFTDFYITKIKVKRQINSKNPGSTVNELLIYNYKIEL